MLLGGFTAVRILAYFKTQGRHKPTRSKRCVDPLCFFLGNLAAVLCIASLLVYASRCYPQKTRDGLKAAAAHVGRTGENHSWS